MGCFTYKKSLLTALTCALTMGAAAGLSGCASTDAQPAPQRLQGDEFEKQSMAVTVSEHLGVTSESAATVLERLFKEQGTPSAYITGEEGGGALVGGAFYGKGTLWMRDGSSMPVYWQGPTIGFDTGIDASKVFTLVYNLDDPNFIFQRFFKAEGSAFLFAGMGVNYQTANGVTLAPVRSGVGARLGANIGYSSYTRKRSYIPL